MKTTDLGNNWQRISVGTPVSTDAYLTCHGSWSSGQGWTASPSSIHFYTFHGDSIYTAEIHQVLSRPARLSIGSDAFDVSARQATSISGPDTLVWNYSFTCWDNAHYQKIVDWWKTGPLMDDLLTLSPGDEGTFSFIYDGRSTSSFAQLFTTLNTNNIKYERIHFLVCRAVEGEKIRKAPKNTKELYQQKTPYW
jgi:hypothetical protein